jgi:NAD(P)H-flavin reductase
MRETQAIIERVRRISADLQQLDLSTDPSLSQLQPGHSLFAHLLENTQFTPYLREQWFPIAVGAARVVVELPPQQRYHPGQVVSLLSPVGRPIPLRANVQRVLLIAHDTLPTPFILLAQQLIASQVAVTLVLSGTALRYPLELLPPEIEVVHGDSGWTWPDQVQTINWADQVIALAPPYAQIETYGALYEMIAQLRPGDVPENYVLGLFHQPLACGTGACQACQVTCKGGDLLACTDGPAIDLKRVSFR